MATVSRRKLAVGLPVYNGENYLETTLRAILAQTFEDFELIICDNASTDSTPEIVARVTGDDPRVRYIRHPRNLGAAPNYNSVYQSAEPSVYFCWLAHDDLPTPRYLEACVEALDSHPETVLAFTHTFRLDSQGKTHGQFPNRPNLRSDDPSIRFSDVIHQRASTHPLFGVMRREAVDRTRLHGSYAGSDRTFLAEMALIGPWIEVPEPLFHIRDHPGRYTRAKTRRDGLRTQNAWFDTANAGRITLPRWRRLGAYVTAVARADLRPEEKVRAYRRLGAWITDRNWKVLLRSLAVATAQLVSRMRRRLFASSNSDS